MACRTEYCDRRYSVRCGDVHRTAVVGDEKIQPSDKTAQFRYRRFAGKIGHFNPFEPRFDLICHSHFIRSSEEEYVISIGIFASHFRKFFRVPPFGTAVCRPRIHPECRAQVSVRRNVDFQITDIERLWTQTLGNIAILLYQMRGMGWFNRMRK